jgi:serine/threonine protein kinase
VHRDVKPSNIIFVGGVPKLADIGLVADLSDARSFVGTEGFIPPEGPGAPQADLYGLGKVLYEAATGKDRRDFPQLSHSHPRAVPRAWTYPVSLTNLVAVELEVLEQLAGALGVGVSERQRALVHERLRKSLSAYQLARQADRIPLATRADYTTAIELYHQAITEDRNYVRPYLGLAVIYRNSSDLIRPAKEAMPESLNYTKQAQALDDTHPHVYHHLAAYELCYAWNWDAAEALYRKPRTESCAEALGRLAGAFGDSLSWFPPGPSG